MVSLHAALVAMALSGAGQTVLYDFYADWCGPCRAMGPTVEALIAKGYPVQRVNVDQYRAFAQQFRVESLPCFVMVVDGREVDRVVGGTTMFRLERMCRLARPRARDTSPPLLVQASGSSVPGASLRAASAPGIGPAPPFANQTSVAPPWSSQPVPPSGQGPSAAAVMPVSYQRDHAETADARLLAASVRLQVADPNGRSCGSGTIIDSRDGKALVLTCGHIFRDSGGKGRIEVDLFGPNGPQRVPGELVSFDANVRDVGLVMIRIAGPVVAARVAPPGYPVRVGQAVISVGCNQGDPPTPRHSRISALDKYVYTGPANAAEPANIEVADQPVEGRSGGGLFSPEGYLLGVCNAADPGDKEGLYASLGPIYAELDRVNLSALYRTPGEVPNPTILAAAPATTAPATLPPLGPLPGMSGGPSPSAPSASPMSVVANGASNVQAPAAAAGPATTSPLGAALPPYEQAALSDLKYKAKQGATIVCIVNNPNGKSEVYVIDNASAGLRRQLSAVGRPPTAPYPTSFEVPRPRRTILEWSAESNPADANRSWRADR